MPETLLTQQINIFGDTLAHLYIKAVYQSTIRIKQKMLSRVLVKVYLDIYLGNFS